MEVIKLMRDPSYAPGAFIIARRRSDGSFSTRDKSNTIVISEDTDWPAVARLFGANFADDQIFSAQTWLQGNIGTCASCASLSGIWALT